MHGLEAYLFLTAFLMILSVFSSRISDKFQIPVLIIFLGLGMLAGSDGILGIHFDDTTAAQNVGTLALIFILFGGGLDTQWQVIKPVLKSGLILATLGVFLTAVFLAVCVYFVLDLSVLEALLLGAIISSTDAAAVFAILRAKGIALKKGLSPILELESGSNDPMAIFLTVAILQLITLGGAVSLSAWAWGFFLQFFLGITLGLFFGISLPKILNKIHLSFYGLYPVLTIAWALLTYSFTSLVGGNGFLAIYIAAVLINTKDFVHKKKLIGFHDGLSWIMQVAVFLTLGLLVFPSQLPDVALNAFFIAVWLMFIARPAGIFLSMIASKFSIREKAFISWVGLRGAVPIILAIYPYNEGLANAPLIFNTVFFMVLLSILIQGSTLPFAARFLGVEEQSAAGGADPSSPLFYTTLKQFFIDEDARVIGKSIAELELPNDFLVLLVKRDGDYIRPGGSTIFQALDTLLIQCDDPASYDETLRRVFN